MSGSSALKRLSSKALCANRLTFLKKVRGNGTLLAFGSDEFRIDRKIVLTAVKQSWEALRSASKELLADREIISAAVQHH